MAESSGVATSEHFVALPRGLSIDTSHVPERGRRERGRRVDVRKCINRLR